MWGSRAHRAAITIALVATAALVAGAIVPLATAGAAASHPATAAKVVTIGGPAPVQPVRAGFLGLSFEYSAIEPYAGTNPAAIDPVLLQLVRNLAPGQAPVIRIGGESTDWAWWPVAGMPKPPGATITLTAPLLRVTRALAEALRARLILGINLEADSAVVARDEARALLAGIGKPLIEAFELGNEPEDYGIFNWDGSGATGRPSGYDFPAFVRDFARLSRALPFPLAGPAMGAPKWYRDLPALLVAEPQLRLVTLHRYPVQQCYVSPRAPNYPTIAHILSSRASRGLADSVASEVAAAHARGLRLRIDEMNTVSCGDEPQVGFSFASALWALDALFAMANVGVDGVNIHTYPTSTSALFNLTRSEAIWRASVEPEYYGLLMFVQAAPPGSRLLRVAGAGALKAWATRAPDGHVRLVLINASASERERIEVKASGRPAAATLERLGAPSLSATSGVSLGGQSFGTDTESGQLSPTASSVSAHRGHYAVVVPPASAALLTLPRCGSPSC
jgi:hypothetical protein